MIKFGNSDIKDIRYGADQLKAVYYGQQKIWPLGFVYDNKMIVYKTSDNQPVDLDKSSNNCIGYKVISNEYNAEIGCCVAKFNDEISEIPETYDFSNDGKIFNNRPNVTDLVYVPNTITKCGSFLYICKGLTSLDLTPLSNVTSVGSYFLGFCSGLTSLDLTPLSNLTSIPMEFLEYCSGLTSLDLTPLSNVTSVGSYFLEYCSGLTSLDLTPLTNIISIKDGFLSGCSGLTSLDLTPLSNVTSIGSSFLSGCSGLTSLDLTPLSNVTSIGSSFLSGCSGLTSLDLTPLSNVTSVGSSFLQFTKITQLDLSPISNANFTNALSFLNSCTKLETIIMDHPDGIVSVPFEKCTLTTNTLKSIYVNDDLLEGYKTLVPKYKDIFKPLSSYLYGNNCIAYKTSDNEPVELSQSNYMYNWFVEDVYDEKLGCRKMKFSRDVTDISTTGSDSNGGLFSNCDNLTEIVWLPTTINNIGSKFVYECHNLTKINFSGLKNLGKIGNDCFSGLTSMTSLDVSTLTNVTELGDRVFYRNTSITNFDLSPMTSLTKIGNAVCGYNTSLSTINLEGLTNVVNIGSGFMMNCTSLSLVDISSIYNLSTLGLNPFAGCSLLKVVIMDYDDKVVETWITEELLSLMMDNGGCIYVPDSLLDNYRNIDIVTTDFQYIIRIQTVANLPTDTNS